MNAVLCLFVLCLVSANAEQEDLIPCRCDTHDCQCCTGVHFKVPLTSKYINFTACVAFGVDFRTETAEVRVITNGKVIVDKNFTGTFLFCFRASPPVTSILTKPIQLCGGFLGADICIALKPQGHTDNTLTECLNLQVSIVGVKVWDQDFACFTVRDTQKLSLHKYDTQDSLPTPKEHPQLVRQRERQG